MSRARAIATINETMQDCLPPGAPLSFSEITYAAFQGNNRIVANVVMFDGLPATLHLNRWAYGWSHGWDTMQGGDCFLDDDGQWKRLASYDAGLKETTGTPVSGFDPRPACHPSPSQGEATND